MSNRVLKKHASRSTGCCPGLDYWLSVVLILMVAMTTMAVSPVNVRAESRAGNLIFIMDGSGSMWDKINGKEKIAIAKEVLLELIDELPEGLNIGLVVFGQNIKKGCEDVEELVPLGPLDKKTILDKLKAINPVGVTPISLSVRQTADRLKGLENETTIVLISDGKETCGAVDPCVLVKELKEVGIKFVMNVVGLDVTEEAQQQLDCIAQAGGGLYFSARSAGAFNLAVRSAVAKVAKVDTYAGKRESTAPSKATKADALAGRGESTAPAKAAETDTLDHGPEITVVSAGEATIRMVSIPAGFFVMGSTDGSVDERPVHQVAISPFVMNRTEITQAQYRAVMGENPSHFKGDSLPVESVNWSDAVEFCRRLSQITGKEYSLPTEAEWEYACRAGTRTKYNTGDRINDLHETGWYNGNSGRRTHSVGQKTPNVWGLYDMSGNVGEWCSDWFDPRYYSKSSNRDPAGPETGSFRVERGGGWSNGPDYCRSAYRNCHSPDSKSRGVGFRIVSR